MNRPLALIEGDLAVPLPLPFDKLPPPFGGGRLRVVPKPEQHSGPSSQVAKSIHAVPPKMGRRFPPGAKILVYKAPPPRADSGRFDEALAEAKRYQEMDTFRPRSSRSDHVCSALIFAGCSIALAWLVTTCSMQEAQKAQIASVLPATQPAVSTPATAPSQQPVASVVADVHTASQDAVVATAANTDTLRVAPVGNAVLPQVVQSAKAAKKAKTARFTQAQLAERQASARVIRSSTRPSVSRQPEWTAPALRDADETERAQWLKWANQQPRVQITTRESSVPADTNWNAHMTQRRVTDDPDAFQHDDRSKQ
ncbi:hypothetical protein [Paraburkholderia fungorum]|uniref:hypothetical protein n=1 Tax=Paraburkholderia fungorum TaxID=134537 RepID=UPI0004107504|nr:hypothetical protein [Paraburkholderia fungorum]PZR42446.1 MAG: hypothetical protein DI523_30790 [Paraburkholderia fungorum]QLD52152.1 hypothetical protein C9419_24755 [Paraburkholderia fungorum]